MIQFTSKAARIVYSVIASIIIILIWRNIGLATTLLDIPGNSIPGLSIKTLLLTFVTLGLTIIVIKPKESFSFLGLSRNILQGLGLALLCVLPLYLVFLFLGDINIELTFPVFYDKCVLTGFKEELVFRAFMFGMLFRYAKPAFSGPSYYRHSISVRCISIRDTMPFRHSPLSA